jgi:flagellar motor switch protein FliN/FliY
MSVLATIENAKLVVDQWAEGLADVLGAMTDQRPEIVWTGRSGAVAADSEALWWEQPFQPFPDMIVWVAAPKLLWEHAGSVTLQAAGLETLAPAEIRNTWFEILGQALNVMARSLTSVFGREVSCDPGLERPPDREVGGWASVAVRFPGVDLPPLVIALSARMLALLAAPTAHPENERSVEPESVAPLPRPSPTPAAPSRTMDLLLDVDLPVSISFGKTQLSLKDALKLTTGSIVELNRGVNDQVEVLVNQCLIARGEVVVVEGNYGVRIQQIASRQDRLRSMR